MATILEYGETLCKDKGIFDEEKQVIRSEMKSMESSLSNSRNNIEKRKQEYVIVKLIMDTLAVRQNRSLFRKRVCLWRAE